MRMKGRPKYNNKPNFNKKPSVSKDNSKQQIDNAFVREMELHHANNYPTYKNYQEWVTNFDKKKAIDALEKYYIPKVLQSYKKEYGSTGYDRVSKANKRAIAVSVYEDYEGGMR